ncbi:MAG: carboxypeptidase regulatory-like domain-containing protein [Longimicrobiales bacterium]
MKGARKRLLLLTIVLTGLGWDAVPAASQSQTTSAVRGIALRSDGRGLSEALVRIRHDLSGAERTVLTDQDGQFLLALLQPGGPYTLTISLLGFADGVEEGIQLRVGETHLVEMVLEEQALAVEGVSVRVERRELFNRSQQGPVTLLGERTLEAIPLPSRDIMDLTVLSPLVRTTEGGGFSVGGQNDRYNAILVDGLQNGDPFGLTPGGIPGGQAGAKLLPIDAVSQYEVLVAPYDIRLSGFAGGVMNAVTKTGTNDWRVRGFAVGRHDALMGDLMLPSGPAEASGIRRALLGLSAGGPILRDKAHFFVATEFERRTQPPSGYNLGRDPAALVGIVPEALEAFQDFFRRELGVETGLAGPYDLNQELANVFARADWNFDGGSRLTVRHVFAHARNDESPNRSPFQPYELSSNAVFRRSTNNTASAQFFQDLGNRGGNEVDLTIQRITDETEPGSSYPQVEAVVTSPAYSYTATRPVRAGAQFFAQENSLVQTSVRLSNTLTLARGRSTWTAGVLGTWYDIEHTYLPGAWGEYFFASLTDVFNNAPQRFQRTVLEEGQAPGVRFQVAEMGAFLQDQIVFGNGLTANLGIRADVPFVLDEPQENERVLSFFERSTSQVPSGMILLSPRVGLNWQREAELKTQLRGGFGLFTGQLPYVWLANSFENTGLRSVTQACFGRWTDDPLSGNTAPPFDANNPNPTCLAGRPSEVRVVTLFEDGFRYPQYLKLSAAVDQELTPTLSASLGVIFSHSINQVLLRELNIFPQERALGPLRGYGGTDRTHFGVPTDDGFYPTRLLPGYQQVLLVTNGTGDRSWSLSAEVRGAILDNLEVQAGYAYSRSYDRMSLASVDLISNYGFTPTHGDPNDPPLTPSNFDRPHKVVLALYGTPIPGLERTEVSLLYTGESGLPFSYVYGSDLNGDGYPFLGPAFDRNNDLLYTPLVASEVPSSYGTFTRLAAALETDPCLKKFRGTFVTRNGCRAPWHNRVDLRMAHNATLRGAHLRLEADLINVLNLMNRNWGLVKTIPPVSSLLAAYERVPATAELLSEWDAGILPFRDDKGNLVTPEPWSVASPASQWQAQFGIRVTFGGG